jgi:L-ascorbate metabolism protein UlaG (beta-lactamase superfamily)
VLSYGGRSILVDAMLDPAGARPPIANTPNQLANPLIDLPDDWESLIAPVDTLLVTHLHQDHFDETAARVLDKRLPLLGQPDDVERLRAHGFIDLQPVESTMELDGISIERTPAQHGTGAIAEMLAPVSGFVLASPGEPVVYLAGDTIDYPPVREVLERRQPDVVILNAGGARFLEGDPIVMTVEDVAAIHHAAPEAELVIVHLDAINHCIERRADYRERLPGLGVDMARIHIPEDGETLEFAGC